MGLNSILSLPQYRMGSVTCFQIMKYGNGEKCNSLVEKPGKHYPGQETKVDSISAKSCEQTYP